MLGKIWSTNYPSTDNVRHSADSFGHGHVCMLKIKCSEPLKTTIDHASKREKTYPSPAPVDTWSEF